MDRTLTFNLRTERKEFKNIEVFRMFEIDKKPKIAILVNRPRAMSVQTVFEIEGLTTVVNHLSGSTTIYCSSITEITESCNS